MSIELNTTLFDLEFKYVLIIIIKSHLNNFSKLCSNSMDREDSLTYFLDVYTVGTSRAAIKGRNL